MNEIDVAARLEALKRAVAELDRKLDVLSGKDAVVNVAFDPLADMDDEIARLDRDAQLDASPLMTRDELLKHNAAFGFIKRRLEADDAT